MEVILNYRQSKEKGYGRTELRSIWNMETDRVDTFIYMIYNIYDFGGLTWPAVKRRRR